jgi:serine/threonine protein kinase
MFAEDGRLKLIDFGVATQLKDTFDSVAELDFRNGCYTAPEVWNGTGYQPASDWWAFGVLIFEMLAGRRPYGDGEGVDDGAEELRSQMSSGMIEFPEGFDDCTRDLIRGLMVVEWEKRLGGAAEDAEEIMRHPWFCGIDWQTIGFGDGLPRLWVDVDDRSDLKYFPEYEVPEEYDEELTPEEQSLFEDF